MTVLRSFVNAVHFRALLGRFVSDFARKPAKLSVQWRWLVGLLLLKAMFGCVATCSTERLSRVNSHVHTTTAIGSMFSRVRVFGLQEALAACAIQ